MTKPNFINNLVLENLNSDLRTGIKWLSENGPLTESLPPVNGSVIANVQNANREDYETIISKA